MDFKDVDPAAIDWSSWYRGQPAARLLDQPSGESHKLVVQTPLAPCNVSLSGAGMYRIDLSLDTSAAVHRQFCEWLEELDRAVASREALADWRRGKSQSSTLYNSRMRVTAFSDTLCFDAEGQLSFELLDAAACSCLLELQGCWSTDSRWGLRWRVAQVKFTTEPPTAFVRRQHQNQTSSAPQQQFAFLLDD